MSKEFWNERYTAHASVYGPLPNNFFKEQIDRLAAGKLLLPAEGEGRNAIYAAKQGWEVDAFDYSEAAKARALDFAAKEGLAIHYQTKVIGEGALPLEKYDAIALIYVHLPMPLRKQFHQQCMEALKPGGVLIMEAFCKEQINNQSGGPKDINMLYDLSEIFDDFQSMKILRGSKEDIFLEEGNFHIGLADVIRLVLQKEA